MRWFWIDRFTEFVSGQHATAVKSVSLAEEVLHDHFPGLATMPNSLIIEGMAQTGGLLAAQHFDFRERVVLAKVARITFHRLAEPGHQLTYRADLEQIDETGAITAVTSHLDGVLQAEGQLFFAHLDRNTAHRPLFTPHDIATMARSLRIFEVGTKPDGSPLRLPDPFREAEAAAMQAAGRA